MIRLNDQTAIIITNISVLICFILFFRRFDAWLNNNEETLLFQFLDIKKAPEEAFLFR